MRVENYRIKDWEQTYTGLLIAENSDWVLVKSIPVDYVIDGFRLLNKEFIQERCRSEQEEQIEKVLLLKSIKEMEPENFHFSDTAALLVWVEKNYEIFEFQDDDETEVFYGRISRLQENELIIDLIRSDGAVGANYEYEFNVDEIHTISFESDYHWSIRLLWKDKLKGKTYGNN